MAFEDEPDDDLQEAEPSKTQRPSKNQRVTFVAVLMTLSLALIIINTTIIISFLRNKKVNMSRLTDSAETGLLFGGQNLFAPAAPAAPVVPLDQFPADSMTRPPLNLRPTMMPILTLAPWSDMGSIYNRTNISDSSTGNRPSGSDTPTGTSGSGYRPTLINEGSPLNRPDGDDADPTGVAGDQLKRPGGSNQPAHVNGSVISINAVDGTDLNGIGDQGQNGLIGTNNATVSRDPTTKKPMGPIGTNNLTNNVNNVYNIYNIYNVYNASYITKPATTTKKPTTTTKKPTTTTTTKKPTTTTKKPTTTTTTKKPTTTTKKPTTTTKKPTTTTKKPTTTTTTTTTTKKPTTTEPRSTLMFFPENHHFENDTAWLEWMREKYQYAQPGYNWVEDTITCKKKFTHALLAIIPTQVCEISATVGLGLTKSFTGLKGPLRVDLWWEKTTPMTSTSTRAPKTYDSRLTMEPFPTNHKLQDNKAWLKWMREKYQYARPGYKWVEDTVTCKQLTNNALQIILPTQECVISTQVSDEKIMSFTENKDLWGLDWHFKKKWWDTEQFEYLGIII